MTGSLPVRVTINIDGGARGNPGPAAAGVIIRSADDQTVLHQAGVYLGRATNNLAEYSALIAALETAAMLKAEDVEVLSDSELLVHQLNGRYRVRNEGLKPLFAKAQDLVETFTSFVIRHVPREKNKEADRLVNQALNLKRNVEDAAHHDG